MAGHRATAERLLQVASRERERKRWNSVLALLEEALEHAERAKAADLLRRIGAEAEAAVSASPLFGDNHNHAAQLRNRARQALGDRSQAPAPARSRPTLEDRLGALLRLLLHSSDDVPAGRQAIAAFAQRRPDGEVVISLRRANTTWSDLFTGGYDVGYAMFSRFPTTFLREARPQIERTVRALAAALVAAGAEVRGLSTDAIPVIAFALLHGEIPLGADATSSTVSEEAMNNALISIADEIAEIPAAQRPSFIDLYRLSALLGVAQRYAENTSLTTLPARR